MRAQQFFIHCADDFSLEQEGAEDISVFRHFEEAIEQMRKLQRNVEARLMVFNLQGAVIMDTVFPPPAPESAWA